MTNVGPILSADAPATTHLPVLKGDLFAQRVAEVCTELPPVEPLAAELKYRNILIPGMLGGETMFAMLGFVAHGLRQRGGNVTLLMCDAMLPACTVRKVDHHESACTRWCHRNAEPFASAMRLPHRWYSEFITNDQRQQLDRLAAQASFDEILAYRHRDIELGALIRVSLESFFKVGAVNSDDPAVQRQATAFLQSALYLTTIAYDAIDEFKIDKLVMNDGMKIDWGVFRAVAKQLDIPVDVIQGSTRGGYIVESDRTTGRAQSMPQWLAHRKQPLADDQEHRLEQYLRQRDLAPYQFAGETWSNRISDVDEISTQLGLPAEREGVIFSMFPNIGFDAGKTKTAAAFDTGAEFIVETIRFFESRPQHHLIIKIHPAEFHRTVLDPTVEMLRERFSQLPPNIHVLDARIPVTAHGVIRLSDVCLIYTSTVAVEAAALGKPVILAGGGWHSNRGVTIEARSPETYFELLDAICKGQIPDADGARGRRYAYEFFFRSDLPITHYQLANDFDVLELNLNDLRDIAPGCDSTIDAICRGVLLDEPFINPDA